MTSFERAVALGLGVRHDTEIAAEMGLSRERVRQLRAKAGLPRADAPWRRRVDESSFEGLLGTKPDRVLAKECGVGYQTVRSRRIERGIPRYVGPRSVLRVPREMFGKVPDGAIARRFGLGLSQVANYRIYHGIPPFRACIRRDWSKIPLGQKSDRAVGREYGINPRTVSAARRRFGIKVFGAK